MATDAIREAMAVVRKHCELPANQRLFADNEAAWTLARWLVANAEELAESVRRIQTNVFDVGGYIGPGKLSNLFTTNGTEVFDSLMFDARRLAAALEPIIPTEANHADN